MSLIILLRCLILSLKCPKCVRSAHMSLVSRLETLSVNTDVLRRERSFLEHLDPPSSQTCDETRRSFWDIFSIADRPWISAGCI